MATLLELDTIFNNSRAAHTGGAAPDVDAAIDLRAKVRMALLGVARTLLGGETIKSGAYPADAQEVNESIGWAQMALNSPTLAADAALIAALAGGAGLTTAQILGASDTAIRAGVEGLFPALARGRHPGR